MPAEADHRADDHADAALAFEPIAARPPPPRRGGVRVWLRSHLFSGWASGLASVALLALAAWALPALLDWALWRAVWVADAERCQAARGVGACWGVVAEKYRLILFGRYPFDQQWRSALATLLLAALVVASATRRLPRRVLLLAWVGVPALGFALLHGGVFGLAEVSTERWGGLPLSVLLATLSIALAFPLAVLVALGRRSRLPALRALCVVYVEAVRGVPLVSVLFMASFMLPLWLPPGSQVDVLLRVLAGTTLFAAAYLAEIVRAGLQAVPDGQQLAAASLGLGWWQAQRAIILPQALGQVVPALMNNFIAIFKDTSLVTIVSLYELTGALGLALNSDSQWRPFKLEGYLFIAAIYFAVCFSMSRWSLRLERELAGGRGGARQMELPS